MNPTLKESIVQLRNPEIRMPRTCQWVVQMHSPAKAEKQTSQALRKKSIFLPQGLCTCCALSLDVLPQSL